MYALLTKRRLRWLGHVTRMRDGRLPKDILYGELPLGPNPQEGLHSATKTCASETSRRVTLRQQALKRWQRTAAVGDTLPSQLSRQHSRRERSSGKTRELAGAREQR